MTLLWEIAFYLYGFAELNYLNSLRLSLSDVALTFEGLPQKGREAYQKWSNSLNAQLT